MVATNFGRVLRVRIAEEIDKRAESLIHGAALDYPMYRQSVGYVEGMDTVLAIMDDMEKERN
jgi:hypothetical protein